MGNILGQLARKSLAGRLYQASNFVIVAVAGKRLPVYHLVEYPKCGGSWIRNMMQDYLGGVEYLGNKLVSKDMVIQIHRLYRRIYCNPVIVFRDPRDVFVSFYYHEIRYMDQGKKLEIAKYYKHRPDRPLQDDFASYLEAKLVHRTDPAFTFRDFVQSWLGRQGICRVHYEDFQKDAEAELIKIIRFLRKPVLPERIKKIVTYHSFENETKRRYGDGRKPGIADPQKFQRKGISGDWKNHFNQTSCELIQEHEWESLYRLGYESDRSWVKTYLDSL